MFVLQSGLATSTLVPGRTALWRHKRALAPKPMRLTDVNYASGKLEFRSRHFTEPETSLAGYLDDARLLFASAATNSDATEITEETMPPDFERLRWFPLPNEALKALLRRPT